MPVKPPEDFRVLIVYPNLPLMLVPSLAIALFTARLKKQGYQVELFETTHYLNDEVSSSTNRVEILNVRDFDMTDDLNITIRKDMYGDFRKRVEDFEPDFLIYSVVEDVFLQTLNLVRAIEDLDIPSLVGGVFPTYAPQRCIEPDEIMLVGHGERKHVVALLKPSVPAARCMIFRARGSKTMIKPFTRTRKTHLLSWTKPCPIFHCSKNPVLTDRWAAAFSR